MKKMRNRYSYNELEDQRQFNRRLAGDGIGFNVSEINKILFNLRNTSFTLATFLFAFSSPIIIDLNKFNLILELRILMYIAWSCLFLSMVNGFFQIFFDMLFHKNQLQIFVDRDNIWADRLSKKNYNKDFQKRYKKSLKKYDPSKPTSSSLVWTLFQSICLLVGFALIFVVASLILFQ